MTDVRSQMALELFQRAYQLQMQGEWDLAVDLYRKSISLHPTAEAYTFLGWTYRFQGRLEDAIAECRKAIELDPAFGNPYNDIGAYLIELDRAAEAIPWLEQAVTAARYDSYHFPWYNLGRAYAALECYRKAQECFSHALDIEPEYGLAAEALARLKLMIQ
ncbi:MAG: tetratricopeptide repeat protein [Bryobacterales bacterium]|jgi:tetratricopeptide (TPR) repeat protein|nr:tetratricopeptide repeat protein [Bryobacterales bacterium]